VCNSRYFNKPTRAEFQAHAREALRSSKQRHRVNIRKRHDNNENARVTRDYWKDGNEENESNMDSHDEDD